MPPGRIAYNINAPVLLLHTIQTESALDGLLSTGSLLPDPARAGTRHRDAYSWMLAQMAQRLPTAGPAALWFWAKIRREDLVDNCGFHGGQVLLTCRIPRERVLLSQYEAWHEVLNRVPSLQPETGEGDDAYDARYNALLDNFSRQLRDAGAFHNVMESWPAELREEVERTWQSILDPAAFPKTAYWQATTHWLRSEDVVEVVRFTDRNRPWRS